MTATRKGTAARRLAAVLTSLVFVAAILVPPTAHILKYSPPVPLQDSEPSNMPEFKPDFTVISQIIYKLRRNWLERNFGLRKVLVRLESMMDVMLLKSSTPFDVVLVAKDRWLYLAQENPHLNVINDYRVVAPFTDAELAKWAAVFKERKDWLDKQGIAYLVVVAPNKASIYPEHIQRRFNKARASSKLDQMVDMLRGQGVDILDLRPCLTQAKVKMLSYYRTDSHWTPHGAFQAYKAVTDRLGNRFARMTPMTEDDFTVSVVPGLLGGLSYMIALGDLFPEEKIVFTPKKPFRAKDVTGGYAQLNHFQPLAIFETGDTALPKAVVIRDSFAHELIPFMSEHFSRVVYTWPFPTDAVRERLFDKELILREKPDVVIDEFVERYFTQKPPPQIGRGER